MVESYRGTVGAPELEPMVGKAFKLTRHTIKIEDIHEAQIAYAASASGTGCPLRRNLPV